jgi:hypothetical protein
LPNVLYGFEMWPHIFREGYSLRVSKNILVRKLSGPNSGDVIEGWSNLQNEKLHDLYVWRNTIRVIKPGRMRWAGHVICTREEEDAYKVLAVNLKKWHCFEGSPLFFNSADFDKHQIQNCEIPCVGIQELRKNKVWMFFATRSGTVSY